MFPKLKEPYPTLRHDQSKNDVTMPHHLKKLLANRLGYSKAPKTPKKHTHDVTVPEFIDKRLVR